MKSIYEILLRRYVLSSFIQFIVIGAILASAIFILNGHQAKQNREELRKISTISFEDASNKMQRQIEQIFEHASLSAENIRVLTENILAHKNDFKNETLEVRFDGKSYKDTDDKGFSSIYTTNIKELTQENRSFLGSLSRTIPLLKSAVNSNMALVDSAWINLDKYFALTYPPIDVESDIPEDLDVTEYKFYFSANQANNPKRENVFIDLNTEPWSLQLGEIAVILSPLYKDDAFVGVVGLNITVDKVAETISKIELPFDSYFLVVDKENRVIASSDEKKLFANFGKKSFFDYYKTKTDAAIENVTKIKIEDHPMQYITLRDIAGTSFRLVLIADKMSIYKNINTLYKEGRQTGLYLIAFILFFYILFFFLMLQLTKRLSLKIANPLQGIVELSRELGKHKGLQIEESHISEFCTLNSNLLEANRRLSEMLIIDTLTSLYNKKKLFFDLENRQESTLFLFSLDHFKNINDTYGNIGGDEIVKMLAARVEFLIDERTRVYKTGVDEFAILHAGIEASPKERIEHIQKELTTNLTYNDIELDITLTFGISFSNSDMSNNMTTEAEIALSEAKKSKRGSYVIYSPDLIANRDYEMNIKWGKVLKKAIENDNIIPFFQPIYDIKNNKITKFEALARLKDGDKIIPPIQFIGPAKNIGLLDDITKIMIEKVFETASLYQEYQFSINVSFSDFENEEMFVHINNMLEKYKIESRRIVLEVLETEALIGDKSLEIIAELKRKGFEIAIDDFGSGYSNFGHFMKIGADYLKIDGEFIKNIDKNRNSEKISEVIATFAKKLEIKTIAEFVASEDIFQKVADLNIDYAQGYLISPPIGKDEIGNLKNFLKT